MKIFKETYNGPRYKDNKKYMMHGTTSVMDHCVNVAYTAYYMSYKLGIEVNEAELIRGALLHDYFLYDWHENHGLIQYMDILIQARRLRMPRWIITFRQQSEI